MDVHWQLKLRERLLIGGGFVLGCAGGSWAAHRFLNHNWLLCLFCTWTGAAMMSLFGMIICKLVEHDPTKGPFYE